MEQSIFAPFLQRIQELEYELARAYHDPRWAILTCVGVERRLQQLQPGCDLVYGDIDFLHHANEHYGHAGVNQRMLRALQFRMTDFVLAGRWESGDELVFVCPSGTGEGAAHRLLSALHDQGLSATFCVIEATHHYAPTIQRAQACVAWAKAHQERGQVFVI